MSKRIARTVLSESAIITAAPPRSAIDRTFELPTRLYVLTAACYFGFLLVMSLALMEPGLAIPMAICVLFVAMFAGTAAKWARMDPPNPAKAMGWNQFQNRGIATYTGRVAAGDATVQVLILPVLILVWGVIIAVTVGTLG